MISSEGQPSIERHEEVGMEVLLIQPNYRRARESRGGTWGVHPPLGLCYMAAVLERSGIPVEILDANALDLTEEEVTSRVRERDPSIVGFSMLTPAHSFCVNVAKNVRDGRLLVVGGAHATALPKQLLREGFDVVVRGEGEYAMLDLAEQKPLESIQGISYRTDDGAVRHNPDRPPIADLDALPFPSRQLLPSQGVDIPYRPAAGIYSPWATILTSRGCPYGCYFCNKNIFGYGFRPRSPENVVDEIEFLVEEYGVKEIDIADDVFNFDLNRAEGILDLIIERELDIYIRATNGLRIDRITAPFLERFKRAGGAYIAYGIESGVQEVLDLIPKAVSLEQIRRAVELTKKAGLRVSGFFVFGLLGDTPHTMRKTIEFAKELDLDVAVFNILAPYPGTRLWEIIEERGGKILLDSYDDFYHTADRALFTFPNGPEPKDVVEAYRTAHKEFYFRPKYMLKQLLKVRSKGRLRELIQGFKSLIQIAG